MATLLIVAAFGYLALCAAMWGLQDRLLYRPQRDRAIDAPLLRILTEDGHTNVSTLEVDGAAAVLYFGGNAEDASTALPMLHAAFPAAALYTLHYRGYGGSDGAPGEAALFADALALYDKVAQLHPRITLVGVSLGSGVAVYVAAHRPTQRLVLETPYDSIESVAAARFWFVPVHWLLRDRYDSVRHAPDVRAPTLLIVAMLDRTIPPGHADRLADAFRPGLARIERIDGASHASARLDPRYPALLRGEPVGD